MEPFQLAAILAAAVLAADHPVVLAAIVPTAVAQRWFSPDLDTERAGDARMAATAPALADSPG
jgi:hypothetical protein